MLIQMLVGGALGIGTIVLLCLAVLLIVFLVLYICRVKPFKYIFWIFLLIFIIAIIVAACLPTTPLPEDVEFNDHGKKMILFGVFICLGLVVAVIFFVFEVLLYKDRALVLRKVQITC